MPKRLRRHQRALRCDPQAAAIVRAILPLTVQLKRDAEAVRYALKSVELEEADPRLLHSLAIYLTEEGDWARAITLYEKALAARGKNKEVAEDIIRRMELGHLYQVAGKGKEAADCFARVIYALDHPDEFAIDDQTRRILLGEPVPSAEDFEALDGKEKKTRLARPGAAYQLMGECFLAADRRRRRWPPSRRPNSLPPTRRCTSSILPASMPRPANRPRP